jgi:hypothetical protein
MEIRAHIDDVRVGKLVVEERIGIGSVAVVGGPGLCVHLMRSANQKKD